MVERMVEFFVSWFVYPGLTWISLLLGTALALAFGAIWFTLYSTPILKRRWAWLVLVGSALLSVIAVTVVQIPLQYWTGLLLLNFWSNEVLMGWLLLDGGASAAALWDRAASCALNKPRSTLAL